MADDIKDSANKLAEAIDADVLLINAAMDRGIESRIQATESPSLPGKYRQMTHSKRIEQIQRDKSRELRELLNRQHRHLQPVKPPPAPKSSSSEVLPHSRHPFRLRPLREPET
jgi:hypothetical protein